MATIGTITVPVTFNVTMGQTETDLEARVANAVLSIESFTVGNPAGNTNPSLTTLAAAMNGLSVDEFALLGAYEQGAYRDLAHNLTQAFQVTPR